MQKREGVETTITLFREAKSGTKGGKDRGGGKAGSDKVIDNTTCDEEKIEGRERALCKQPDPGPLFFWR